MCRTPTALLILSVSALSACGAVDAERGPGVAIDTLPNGAVRLRYATLPPPTGEPAAIELSIGELEGEAYEIFGDVRSIEADADGNIYILDYQASEVRAFDAQGNYLRTLTRKGAGPGELTAANSMILMQPGTLWVQDHGQMQNIALDLEGREITRFPMQVRDYGYTRNGTVDASGRFWRSTSHPDDERVVDASEGVMEATSRRYFVWFDRNTGQTDSVFLGDVVNRWYISRNSRGSYTYRGIPFTAPILIIVDPAGGFWTSSAEAYRIARLDAAGDTVLVIEADVPPVPVTEADRAAFVAAIVEREPESRDAAEELAGLAPSTRPALDQLIIDDERRLWVRRAVAQEENAVYDVFSRDGEYLGGVRVGFKAALHIPPRIRNGKMYMLVRDSLDVPRVVRTTVPPLPVRPLIGAAGN